MNTLVGETEHTCGIARAHFQPTSTQDSHRSPSRHRRTAIFLFCLPPERRVRSNCLLCCCRQLDVVDDLRGAHTVDEQLHSLDNAAPRLVHGATLRVAATQSVNRVIPE